MGINLHKSGGHLQITKTLHYVQNMIHVWLWCHIWINHNLSQVRVNMSQAFKWCHVTSWKTKWEDNFAMQQIYLVVHIYFHVTSVLMLYHDCKTSKCCNRRIFSLTTCEILQHAASFFCIRQVHYKTLVVRYSETHIPWKPLSYYILNIKMTSKSLSKFTKLHTCSS